MPSSTVNIQEQLNIDNVNQTRHMKRHLDKIRRLFDPAIYECEMEFPFHNINVDVSVSGHSTVRFHIGKDDFGRCRLYPARSIA